MRKEVRLPGLNLLLGYVETTDTQAVFTPPEQFLEFGGSKIPPRSMVRRKAVEGTQDRETDDE